MYTFYYYCSKDTLTNLIVLNYLLVQWFTFAWNDQIIHFIGLIKLFLFTANNYWTTIVSIGQRESDMQKM